MRGFDALGLPRADRNAIRRVVGLPLLTAIQQLLPDASTTVVEQVRAGYGQAWHQLRETDGLDEPLFPGLMPTLDRLEQDGWLLGVATRENPGAASMAPWNPAAILEAFRHSSDGRSYAANRIRDAAERHGGDRCRARGNGDDRGYNLRYRNGA